MCIITHTVIVSVIIMKLHSPSLLLLLLYIYDDNIQCVGDVTYSMYVSIDACVISVVIVVSRSVFQKFLC